MMVLQPRISDSESWTPPTQRPEAGQGPWCDLDGGRHWVIADNPGDALNVLDGLSTDIFPIYFGWRAVVERVCIRWVDPEVWSEESEIVECLSDYPWHTEAWRITLEDC